MLILLSLLVGNADAADYYVPGDFETLEDAVNAANENNDNRDVIHLLPTVRHAVLDTMTIESGNTIVIVGEGSAPSIPNPPSEINDPDAVEDVQIVFDFSGPIGAIRGTEGLFIIDDSSSLVIRRVVIKGIERSCEDGEDNDGNGWTDIDDPGCVVGGGGTGAAPPVDSFRNVRVFTMLPESTLHIDESLIQGWNLTVGGTVLRADFATEIKITDSIIAFNDNWYFFPENYWWEEGYGTFMVTGPTDVIIEGSRFLHNSARKGGVFYAVQGANIDVRDSVFDENNAEDGGVFFLELASFTSSTSIYASNIANLVPEEDIWPHHEGGVIWAEDSNVSLTNNVFFNNNTLDRAGVMFARRNLGAEPYIVNNTIVDNGAQPGSGVFLFDETTFTFVNNAATHNSGGLLAALNWPSPSGPYVEYNDLYGNVSALGGNLGVHGMELALFPVNQALNIFEDPQYAWYAGAIVSVDWQVQRFEPRVNSPLVDAGDPTITDVGGTRSDIGAFGGLNDWVEDVDGDGWEDIFDCDDSDAAIFPEAPELCDDLDNDCNGVVDDRETVWYVDVDYDGWGDPEIPGIYACPEDVLTPLAEGIYVNVVGDCDDNNSRRNPGNPEFCDNIDNDCDELVDEDIPVREQWPDDDDDGFGVEDFARAVTRACPPPGFSPFSNDCNDANDDIHPLVTREAQLHPPLANTAVETSEASRNPSFVADGIDQDCDNVDLCYADLDGDTYGAAPQPGQDPPYVVDNDLQCNNLSSLTATNFTDCDDRDALAFPGGDEIVGDGLDQNCDGRDLCYEDRDDDSYGNPLNTFTDNDLDCDNDSAPTSSRGDDCNDDPDNLGSESNPEKVEVCDGVDNNCDGGIDEVTSPDAKEYFRDQDEDGYGVATEIIRACGPEGGGAPVGYAERSGDCNDLEPRAQPEAQEICDGIDNNCQSGIDEDAAIDVRTWYEDLDGDGFGNSELSEEACDEPTEGGPWILAGKSLDCDDSNVDIGPCSNLCGDCSSMGSTGSAHWFALLLSAAAFRRRERPRA